MLSHFICGVSNLQEDQQVDERGHNQDHQARSSLGSKPRKSIRRNNFCSKRHYKVDTKNNPYAMRGLDKFSALLAELEEKKQKIYSQTDSGDISSVRFVYSNSNECVPIVIRFKKKKKKKEIFTDETKAEYDDVKYNKKKKNVCPASSGELHGEQNPDLESEKKPIENERCVAWRSTIKSHQWRWPRNYVPAVLILILFLLSLFGRSFAVLCTCFWWYIVPTIKGSSPVRAQIQNQLRRRKYDQDRVLKKIKL